MINNPLKRVPAARSVARGVRHAWEQLRPLPLARYISGTPNTGSEHILEPYFPPTISTITACALSCEAADFVLDLVRKLSPTEETVWPRSLLRLGIGKVRKALASR